MQKSTVYNAPGGASGGGSVFILSCKRDFKQGTVDVLGGPPPYHCFIRDKTTKSGAGGQGSVNICFFEDYYLLKATGTLYNQEGKLEQ